jgi:putative FmdB family regulatory protein
MPIYAYRCTTCGHAKDVLRKMSDPLLTQCPNCGAPTFVKQVTAAGFKLKGTGWYVTDFRDHGTAAAKGEGVKGSGAHIDVPHATHAADGASTGAASGGSNGGSDGASRSEASKSGASNGDAAKGGAARSAPASSEKKGPTAPAPAPATGATPGQK